jgi:polyisoprenoid-binding protein YceI
MNQLRENRMPFAIRKPAIAHGTKFTFVLLLLSVSYFAWSQKKFPFESAPVKFVIKNAGIKVNGTIEGLEGLLEVDQTNESLIKIEGTVDPNTIETGISLRDNHLKKEEYFNAKEFPRLHIVSTSFTKSSAGKYVGNFALTIKGVKKNFSIPFSLVQTQGQYALKAEFSLNRRDFKVGDNSFILSDDVTVRIDLKTVAKL